MKLFLQPTFIEVPVPSLKSEHSHISVSRVLILSGSTIFVILIKLILALVYIKLIFIYTCIYIEHLIPSLRSYFPQ
jgi:hypothetical protein